MIDCFPFFNELDLLEVRLNSLAPYVKKFVLCEMSVTHSGKPKPLYFQESKDRFKDFNITHLIAPPYYGDPWSTEHYQREYLMNGLHDIDNEEIFFSSGDYRMLLTSYFIGDKKIYNSNNLNKAVNAISDKVQASNSLYAH